MFPLPHKITFVKECTDYYSFPGLQRGNPMLIHTIPHPQHHPPVVEKVNKMRCLQCCQALLWPFFHFLFRWVRGTLTDSAKMYILFLVGSVF